VPRCHCGMIFRRSSAKTELGEGDRFLGQVEPGNRCIIPRDGHQTYLVSEVELTETTWVSRDRGFDLETHEHIWGSALGPLRFEKVQSYAHELPA
jgi:CpeT protein